MTARCTSAKTNNRNSPGRPTTHFRTNDEKIQAHQIARGTGRLIHAEHVEQGVLSRHEHHPGEALGNASRGQQRLGAEDPPCLDACRVQQPGAIQIGMLPLELALQSVPRRLERNAVAQCHDAGGSVHEKIHVLDLAELR